MPVVTRAYEHAPHSAPDLVGTSATRVLACAVGWEVWSATPSPLWRCRSRTGTSLPTTGALAFDHIRWLLPLMISSFGMAYLGWVVWTTMASINGHRVAPLASSPWLPPFAYLVGPAAAVAGSIYKPDANGYWLGGAIVWVCIGHGLVLVSLRSSARRIGSDSDQFTRLIWFPLASIGYRIIAIDGAARHELRQLRLVRRAGGDRRDSDGGDRACRVAGDALVRRGLCPRSLQRSREPAAGVHGRCSPLSELGSARTASPVLARSA